MKLRQAITILKLHNEWRRYDGPIEKTPPMVQPKHLGIAIDVVVKEYESESIQKTF